ncbi:hypothetical protein EVAR_77523_1 [Eumeta japonica]|uniref:Uncharacterized protein n=1 Tax=Eumeta variegata TaxID=151549 RepID=A0A4C1T9D3_EUMVA|nr:hypothetical protein EVAR_77523_1 [Eumeta japonica]
MKADQVPAPDPLRGSPIALITLGYIMCVRQVGGQSGPHKSPSGVARADGLTHGRRIASTLQINYANSMRCRLGFESVSNVFAARSRLRFEKCRFPTRKGVVFDSR